MMSKYKALEDELYGLDETDIPSRAISASTHIDDADVLNGTTMSDDASPASAAEVQTIPKTSPTQKRPWSPDFLAAIAAFTHNPALMQKLQSRDASRRAQEADLAAAPAREQAAARQKMFDEMAMSRENREKEKFEAERPYFGSTARSKDAYASKTNADAAIRAGDSDRNSEKSKAVAGAAASALQAQVAMLDGKAPPQVVAMLKRTADSMNGMSVDEIKQIFKSSPLANIAPQALGEAQRSVQNALAGQANARGWAGLEQANQHHDENLADRIAGRSQQFEARITKDADKINEKVEGWNNAEDLLNQAMEAKKNVDVGLISTPMNKLRQYTPFPNKDFNALQQSLGSVRNEIKLMKSGKAVTPTEEKGLNEELANLEQHQDDATFEQRLSAMLKRIQSYKQRAINQYPRSKSGEPLDRSNTSRVATKQVPSQTEGELGAALRAPAGSKPGQRFRNPKDGKPYEVQPDGTMRPVQ